MQVNTTSKILKIDLDKVIELIILYNISYLISHISYHISQNNTDLNDFSKTQTILDKVNKKFVDIVSTSLQIHTFYPIPVVCFVLLTRKYR